MDENDVRCVLCSAPKNPDGFEGVLGNPEICRLLTKATGNPIEHDPSLPNWLCRICLIQTNQHLEYQNQIYANLMKYRFNHFTSIGDHQRAEQNRVIQPRHRLIDQSLINELHSEPDECSSTTNDNASNVFSDISSIDGSTPATPAESNTNCSDITNDEAMHSTVSSSTAPDDVMILLAATCVQLENITVTETDDDNNQEEQDQATQEEVRHACKFCSKSYLRARSLSSHQRKHIAIIRARDRMTNDNLKPVVFRCNEPKCGKEFKTLKLLRSHGVQHKTIFPCKTCSQTFTLKHDLFWHSAECEARQQVLNDIDAGVIRQPMRPRTRSQSLELTTQNESSASAESESDASSFGGSNNDTSVQRMIDMIERQQSKTEKRKARRLGVDFYKCSICSFGSRSLAETMRHEQRYHRLLLNFYCKLCKDWYTTQDNLTRHRKKHVDPRRCDFCQEIFDSQFDLEYHLLLHYENSFDCNCCHMTFLKSVCRDRHIFNYHNGETPRRLLNEKRGVNFYKTYCHFKGYKSKDLLQKPSANAKILPPRRRQLVWKISRSVHAQLGRAAGIRKSYVNMSSQHYETFSCLNSERDDFETDRQDCSATPSLNDDLPGSPLIFDLTDDIENVDIVTCDDDGEKDDPPDVTPVDTSDDGVYEVLDGLNVFTEPLRASSDKVVVATGNSLEPDVIIIEDSDDDDDNPAGCVSLPPKQTQRKKRRIVNFDLPIQIGERLLPSYEEYVLKAPITNQRLMQQISKPPPLNRPFRYIT